jgi:hypothetical protein
MRCKPQRFGAWAAEIGIPWLVRWWSVWHRVLQGGTFFLLAFSRYARRPAADEILREYEHSPVTWHVGTNVVEAGSKLAKTRDENGWLGYVAVVLNGDAAMSACERVETSSRMTPF